MDKDILQVKGIMSRGYGVIAILAMEDRNLTIQAKGIYGYFCARAGSGNTSFPSVSKIIHDLKVGEDTYYKHLKLLIENGYITKEQVKDEKGKFKHNIYTICTVLNNDKPYPKKPSTDKPSEEKPRGEKQGTNNININNSNINNSNFNNRINTQSVMSNKVNKKTERTENKKSLECDNTQDPVKNNSHINHTTHTRILQENINYEFLCDYVQRQEKNEWDNYIELLDSIIGIIQDVVTSNAEHIMINKENMPTTAVKSRFLKLNTSHIISVFKKMTSNTTPIINKKNYLTTMLYNEVLEKAIDFVTNENIRRSYSG